jgi:3-oxoadipate enol-lactonase
MASFNCDGDSVFYSVKGSGPAVVLLHSLGGSSATWESLTAHLKDDFTVVAFDAPGHGQTSANIAFTIARYVQHTLALMDHLKLAQFHVLGISMGGRAAVRAALARPGNVKSIIVADTGTGDGSGSPERVAGLRRRMDEIGFPAFAMEYTRSRLMPATPADSSSDTSLM